MSDRDYFYLAQESERLQQENDRLQAEVERLKKDPLCQALTDPDCCCHSCLKDEAIAQMLRTERQLTNQRTTIDGLIAVLKDISGGLNCGDGCHYCPNCDRSMYRLKEQVDAALAAVSKRGDAK